MKRYLLTIGVLLSCLVMRAQTATCTFNYWFDENDAQLQSSELGEGSFLLDVGSLTDGLHALHVLLSGDETTTTQTFLFMKTTPEPAAADLTFHYWFDENDADRQSSDLGNGLFLLDVEGMRDGLHALHVLIEGNGLTTTQTFLFLKAQPQPGGSSDNLTLHYWFDENDAQLQSNDLGDGLFLLDVEGMRDGLHALHVLIEGNGLTTTQTFLFLKAQPQPTVDNLTMLYWFDEDDTQLQSNDLGDGLFLLNADGLTLGPHIINIMLQSNQLTPTLSYPFVKLDSGVCIFNGETDINWSNIGNWAWSIFPQAENGALINNTCQLDEDVTVASLTVAENQSLTIPADRMLTVTGQLTNEEASGLIIEEGGQLLHGSEGVQATVQKTIAPYTADGNDGWNLIASPIVAVEVDSVANLLSNDYDLYYYDELTYYWMNQEFAENGFTQLENAQGYLYANSGEVTLEFPGELQNGYATITVPLSYSETARDVKGFNLIGNPFVHNVISYGSNNVAEGCFRMNETKDDLMVSEVSEADPLKPAEGFFVKATANDASITFNPQRGATMAKSGSIRVEVSKDNQLIDRLLVKGSEGKPLEKFSLKEQRTKVFAVQGQKNLAIVPCEGSEQPINFKAAKNGNYTLTVNADGMECDYLHLIDNLTGNDVDLLVEPAYTFEAKTNDYASRFRLVFSADDAGEDACVPGFAFINGSGNLCIFGVEGETTLQVVDMLGHVLSSETFSDSYEKKLEVATGVYMLRLINGDDVKVQKIVIK